MLVVKMTTVNIGKVIPLVDTKSLDQEWIKSQIGVTSMYRHKVQNISVFNSFAF